MRIDALDNAAVAPWADILDPQERARAARFVFARDRTTFTAAHALVRVVLAAFVPGTDARDWRFDAIANGKPVACLGTRPAALSFNLSHTSGMVGIAVLPSPGYALGFDLESLSRKVTLDVADRFFRPEEVAWLGSLPAQQKAAGFLRLWTLKEAFIKATGKGLAQDLASFWFDPMPPRIHFTPAVPERPQAWQFEQQIIEGDFVAAVGLRHINGAVTVSWSKIDPLTFSPQSLLVLTDAAATPPVCRD